MTAGVFCLDPTSPSVCLVSLWFCLSLSCPRRSCVCGFVSGLLGWMGQSLVSVVLSQPCRQSLVSVILSQCYPNQSLVSVILSQSCPRQSLVSVVLSQSCPCLSLVSVVLSQSCPRQSLVCGFVSVLLTSLSHLFTG